MKYKENATMVKMSEILKACGKEPREEKEVIELLQSTDRYRSRITNRFGATYVDGDLDLIVSYIKSSDLPKKSKKNAD